MLLKSLVKVKNYQKNKARLNAGLFFCTIILSVAVRLCVILVSCFASQQLNVGTVPFQPLF